MPTQKQPENPARNSHRVQVSGRAPARIVVGCRRTVDPVTAAHYAHAPQDGVWWLSTGPRVALFEWARVATFRAP